ncbi:unnamed protein product [Discosporangium mesarthrocarpum]
MCSMDSMVKKEMELALVPTRTTLKPSSTEVRELVPVRTLVQGQREIGKTVSRSADDNALMQSLISLMPHEQADSQFSVTAPNYGSRHDSGTVDSPSHWTSGQPFPEARHGQGRGGGQEGSGPPSAFSSGRALADAALDFLGSTDSLKDLLHLPYTSDAVTIGLHRVGQTLVLDGNLEEVLKPNPPSRPPASAAPSGPSARADQGSRSDSRPQSQGKTPLSPEHDKDRDRRKMEHKGGERGQRPENEGDGWVMVGRGGKPQRGVGVGVRVGMGVGESAADERGDEEEEPSLGARGGGGGSVGWPSSKGRDGKVWPSVAGAGEGIVSIVPGRFGGMFGARPPTPENFWRSFQWELGGMRMILGSNLPVCGTTEHPQVSVRLHDEDEELSLCTCLDYYLDNVMENVPELALCMREKGYIQGCRLVNTEDIPFLGSTQWQASGDGSKCDKGVPLFDPAVVELNATMLLSFLQENCSREGGTYLLHREEGSAQVQLYDVNALSQQRRRRWKWLLAMLCYRFAVRISHHTRQPWYERNGQARGAGAGAGAGTGAGEGADGGVHWPGPGVVPRLRRRQRQLLQNSLQLLEVCDTCAGGL